MQTAELDFYATGVDHAQVRRDRLNRQRETMRARGGSHGVTTSESASAVGARHHRGSYTDTTQGATSSGYQMAPRQVILSNSERARDAQKAEKAARERGGALWDSAIGRSHDRRREWRLTGLQFCKSHFRTSTDPTSEYHPRNKAQRRLLTLSEARQEIEQDPYEPYMHDQIILSQPAERQFVTAIAVTTNSAEAHKAEADAAVTMGASQGRAARMPGDGTRLDGTQTFASVGEGDDAWHAALGGSLASRARAAQTATAMYSDLVAQQAATRGTAYGSPESLNVQVPTSELAFLVRPAFTDSHAGRSTRGGRRGTLSHTSTSAREAGEKAGADGESGWCADTTLRSDVDSPRREFLGNTDGSRGGVTDGWPEENGADVLAKYTSAESKSMRVYAVQMRSQVTNKDTSMVTRNEPTRRGVPVQLPSTWLSHDASQGY